MAETQKGKTVLQMSGGGGGTPIRPVKITAKIDDNTYTADVYGKGPNEAATQSGVTVKVLQIAAGETIPNDTFFPAWLQSWGSILGSLLTIDPARDY